MKEFNIHVLVVPSHTSHKIQPLDDVPFVNLKKAWNSNLLDYLFDSLGCGLSKMDFFIVFQPAWRKAMTVANVQAGFRQTGIYPINPCTQDPTLLRPSQAMDSLMNTADQGKELIEKFNVLVVFLNL